MKNEKGEWKTDHEHKTNKTSKKKEQTVKNERGMKTSEKKQELAKRVKAANDELKLQKSANERMRQSRDPGRVRAAYHHPGRHETTLTVVSGEKDRAGRRSVFKGKVEAREFAMMVQRPRLLHEIVITEYCLSF